MDSTRSSFTAADSLPAKLLRDHRIVQSVVEEHVIPAVHVQLIPTNRCNLSCKFCSCENEDRSLELASEDLTDTISSLIRAGMRSVTITGGGEPLVYPHLNSLIWGLRFSGVSIGLVTNGILLPRQRPDMLQHLTWCRVSYGDERGIALTEEFEAGVRAAVRMAPMVDWAFSYVVSPEPNLLQIYRILELAEELNFTHVRLVADLMSPQNVPMAALHWNLRNDVKRFRTPIIFQDRTKPEMGSECYICYLKPVVTPDGKVYACCGAQYALDPPSRKFPEELCLGTVYELPARILSHSSEPFETRCTTCYYGEYNRILKMLLSNIAHREFV